MGARRGPGRPRLTAKPGRRPKRIATRFKRGKRIRRSAADLEKTAARVLAHVRSNAGHRLEQIGKALKTETAILKRPIANLLAAKKLRTKGRKRGTIYFAGGGGGPKRAARKIKARVHRRAKRARRANVPIRRPVRRARNVSPKRSARRTGPRKVQRAPAHKRKVSRKPPRTAPISTARAVATELALDAAAMSSALP